MTRSVHAIASAKNRRAQIVKRGTRTMQLTQVFILTLVTLSVFHPESVTAPLAQLSDIGLAQLGSAEILLVAASLVVLVCIALSPLGNIRLGTIPEGEQRLSTRSWLSMLCGSGVGVGLMFWCVAEPMTHASSNPFVVMGLSDSFDPVFGVALTLYHWGFHAWAVYGVVAVAIAVACFQRNEPLRFSSILKPMLGRHAESRVGDTALAITLIVIALGLATSLGLAAQSIGRSVDAGEGSTPAALAVSVIALLSFVCMVSREQCAVRWLSLIASSLLIALTASVVILGSTEHQISIWFSSLLRYLEVLPSLSFVMPTQTGSDWHGRWTLAYWGWWIAWAPFIGVFIARISRGRTVRQLIMAMLIVPVGISHIFISVMSGAAFGLEPEVREALMALSQSNPAGALLALLEQLGGPQLASLLKSIAVLTMICFSTQSLNSGLVAMRLLTTGETDISRGCALGWSFGLCAVAFILLQAGGTSMLQSASIVGGLLFSLIFVIILAGLVRSLFQCVRRKPASQT